MLGAHPGREADESERHEGDGDCAQQLQKRHDAQEVGGDDGERLGHDEDGHEARPELGPEEGVHADGGGTDDPEGGALGRNGGEDETHRHRRGDERRQQQVREGVDVLEHAAHVRKPVQVEDVEVVDVDETEGPEQEELRPLGGVAKKDLEVLDEERASGRSERQATSQGLEEPQASEAGLARLLGLAPAREVEASVGGTGQNGEGEGGRPQRPEVKDVKAPLECGKEALPGPEGGEERRHRGLQRRKERGHVGKGLDAQEPLRAHEPEEHHDRHREEEPHEHQDVARPTSGKDVDENERDHGPDRGRDHQEGDDGRERDPVVARRGAPCETDPQEDGQDEGDDHPGGLPGGACEARVEQAVSGNRGREEETEILGEEEGAERRHHGAEGHEGEEDQEEPAQSEADQVVPELLVVEGLPGEPEDDREDRTGHDDADASEERQPERVAPLSAAGAVARAPESREQEVGEGARHTSTSLKAVPPVSLRNTGVR